MSYNFLANETWILLFLETELNLVWQVGGGVGSGISGGSSPSPRILPGPGTGEPPFLLSPLWDPELLAVQVLSPGEAPGRQPLPPPCDPRLRWATSLVLHLQPCPQVSTILSGGPIFPPPLWGLGAQPL